MAFIDRKNSLFLVAVTWITGLGALISLVLVYLQLFVLHAICVYCMTSAGITLLLAITSFYVVYYDHGIMDALWKRPRLLKE